jgi:hypothetical protein
MTALCHVVGELSKLTPICLCAFVGATAYINPPRYNFFSLLYYSLPSLYSKINPTDLAWLFLSSKINPKTEACVVVAISSHYSIILSDQLATKKQKRQQGITYVFFVCRGVH